MQQHVIKPVHNQWAVIVMDQDQQVKTWQAWDNLVGDNWRSYTLSSQEGQIALRFCQINNISVHHMNWHKYVMSEHGGRFINNRLFSKFGVDLRHVLIYERG